MPRLAAFAPHVFGSDVEPFAPRRLRVERPENETLREIEARIEAADTPATMRRKRNGSGIANPKKKREFLYLRQDGRCWFCGNEMMIRDSTLDHLVPFSKGGSGGYDNLVLACAPCNCAKKDRTLEGYRQNPRVSLKSRNGLFYGETVA